MNKRQNVKLLCTINILLLVIMFFLYDIFYVILGYPEYFLADFRSLSIGHYAIMSRLNGIIEPYILTMFLFVSIYCVFCIIRISKFKKQEKKYKYLYWLNLLILVYYILVWIKAIINPYTFKGLLS